jgi:hypothetical protein
VSVIRGRLLYRWLRCRNGKAHGEVNSLKAYIPNDQTHSRFFNRRYTTVSLCLEKIFVRNFGSYFDKVGAYMF